MWTGSLITAREHRATALSVHDPLPFFFLIQIASLPEFSSNSIIHLLFALFNLLLIKANISTSQKVVATEFLKTCNTDRAGQEVPLFLKRNFRLYTRRIFVISKPKFSIR